MIDATLQELWSIKDKLAKENSYDLDNLVCYLKEKYPTDETVAQPAERANHEPKIQANHHRPGNRQWATLYSWHAPYCALSRRRLSHWMLTFMLCWQWATNPVHR